MPKEARPPLPTRLYVEEQRAKARAKSKIKAEMYEGYKKENLNRQANPALCT